MKAEQWHEAMFTDGQFRRPRSAASASPASAAGRGGDANIEEFTERRWLTVNTEPAHYPY